MWITFTLLAYSAICFCNADTVSYPGVEIHPLSRVMRLNGNTFNQVRPGSDPSQPVSIGISADIENMDIRSNDFINIDLTLRQEWADLRLAHNYNFSILFSGDMTDEIWLPDTFFRQVVKEEVNKRSVTLRPDGTVFYSTRARLALVCPGIAYRYARSSSYQDHTCTMDIASYGYSVDDVVYRFKEGKSAQFNPGRYSNKFRIRKLETSDCTVSMVTRSYSCLRLKITLTNSSN